MTYLALLPPILMALFGCATLILDVLAREGERRIWLVWFNLLGQALIGYSFVRQWQTSQNFETGGIAVDGLSLFTNALVWLAVVVLLLTSYRFLDIVHEHRGEYYALALFAQCGMYFMASGIDLIGLFIGLELTAVCFYILVGFTRADRRSNEAALKYLLLGALSSGFVLYGFSLLYGISGSTSLAEIADALKQNGPFALVATITITIGLLFKVSAAPFHNWAPDAYDGAPTPITGYLSVASKIAGFAVLMRLPLSGTVWLSILTVAAVLSLTIGSVAAITQDRVKRLFAYSGIAHAGYVLLGLVAGSTEGVFVYLLVYAVMNLGAFAVLTSLRRHGILGERLSDLRGLSQSHPLHAALFAVLLLSLAGVPPTAGFIGKYFIFAALIQTGHIGLAVVAAIYVVVSLYFYFRLVREMYLAPMEVTDVRRHPIAASFGIRVALVGTAALTLGIGLFPQPALTLLNFAR
ncbi:MAG: NADH-quinone oxidoreductase subunit N [Acidobacteriota bacterium]|nr:NADH-quinone oxidoreductase subunit N [Acidobacteriota bacterium]